MLRQLIRSGMNAARFNFSHGTHESHLAMLQKLKSVRDTMGRPVATILDTKGPEIRIKTFAGGPINLTPGEPFILTTRDVEGDSTMVAVTYDNLHQEVGPDCVILIDDGLVGLRVQDVQGQDIHCVVESGGPLSNNKSINIPGVHIQLPALTEKDKDDIRFGVENDFDYIAASFVRKASDVEEIRQVLHACGGDDVQIIAKIENQEGVDNLDEITAAADAIMVARGDLGVEIPAHKVPILQKHMIKMCTSIGKPVIIATQMLDSMMRNPRPTRAEVSDVANAVFDGASCVMLSGETAGGKYPLEALQTMVRVATEAEDSIDYWKRFRETRLPENPGINTAISHTCCMTAMDLGAKAIVAATLSGHTARMIARFRPACPVAAMTMSEKRRRQMALLWGVFPMMSGSVDSTDRLFALCAECAWKERLVDNGDIVVITAGVPLGRTGATNLIKAHIMEVETEE